MNEKVKPMYIARLLIFTLLLENEDLFYWSKVPPGKVRGLRYLCAYATKTSNLRNWTHLNFRHIIFVEKNVAQESKRSTSISCNVKKLKESCSTFCANFRIHFTPHLRFNNLIAHKTTKELRLYMSVLFRISCREWRSCFITAHFLPNHLRSI